MKLRLYPLIATLGLSFALASCGVKTDLRRPAPMFGKARTNYIAEQDRLKAEAEARAAAGSTAPSATPETVAPPAPNQPVGRTPISPLDTLTPP